MLFAIETSSRHGSIALVSDRGVERRDFAGEHGKTGLAPSSRELLAGRLDRVERYAISIGPGSFTGLRLGLSFLKGLAFAHPRPTIAVSSLDVIASNVVFSSDVNAPLSAYVLSVIDARRHEVFAKLFERRNGELQALETLPEGRYPVQVVAKTLEHLSSVLVVGDGASYFEARSGWKLSPVESSKPDAAVLAQLAEKRLLVSEGVDVAALEPVYHQVSAAEAKMSTA